jgi:hypothetical protein
MAHAAPPTRRQLRDFGLSLPVSAAILGLVVQWRFDAVGAGRIIWAVGAMVTAVYVLVPGVRRPIFMAMSAAGRPIELAVSFVVLAVVFGLVIVPVGLVLRVFRRDPLERGRSGRATYWHERQPEKDTSGYLKPF